MLLVAFNVNGSLKTIQRLEVNDLNFCDESTMEYTHIKFAKNFKKTCSLNLKRLIATHEKPLLYDLYLNYTENNLNLLKSVPVLIRNAFAHNVVSRSLNHFLSKPDVVYVMFGLSRTFNERINFFSNTIVLTISHTNCGDITYDSASS